MIPKGFIFRCPTCGKPLYKASEDVHINDHVLHSISKFVALYPQPLMSVSAKVVQKCVYCERDFNFLDLIKSYWR